MSSRYAVSSPRRVRLTRARLDCPQRHGNFSVINLRPLLPRLRQHRLQFSQQLLSRIGLGGMLVNHTTAGGFEGRGKGCCSVGDVRVHQAAEAIGGVSCDERMQQEEELVLTFGQLANRRPKQRDVLFLLAQDHGRGMLAR